MEGVERLLAIEEIKQLKGRYFRFLDTKDWIGMRTVFADDAVFDARAAFSLTGESGGGRSAESNGWIYEGGDQINEFIKSAASDVRSVHHGHCHEVEILSQDEARGVIAMEDHAWDGAGKILKLHGYGHYHETYRRLNGRWRIQSSRISRLYVSLGEEPE